MIYVYSFINITNEQIYSDLKLLNELFGRGLFACLFFNICPARKQPAQQQRIMLTYAALGLLNTFLALPTLTVLSNNLKQCIQM